MSARTTAIAIAGASAIAYYLLQKRRKRGGIPSWYASATAGMSPLRIDEWENGWVWRLSNGWVGTDYAHGPDAAVHIAGYGLSTGEGGGIGTRLVGAVHFGKGAESHKGLCHGGTMCTIMDDVIGWTGFCVSGVCKPWCGFTVQVDTNLQCPVTVGSWLRVEGVITAVERRKVRVRASLVAPATSPEGKEVVHCTAEGLFIVKKEAA